jgi:hypothetical protein
MEAVRQRDQPPPGFIDIDIDLDLEEGRPCDAAADLPARRIQAGHVHRAERSC